MKRSAASCTLFLLIATACGDDSDKSNTPSDKPDAESPAADAASSESDSGPSTTPSATPDAGPVTVAGSCLEIVECVGECDDEACLDTCVEGADEDDVNAATSVIYCALLFGCTDDTCVATYCAEEALVCAGIVLPPEEDSGAQAPDSGEPVTDSGTPATDSATPTLGCPEVTGPGTEHSGFLESDEVWTLEDSPHVITSSVSVRGATLTIEPCAVVQLAEGQSLFVGENSGDPASLIAVGEMDEDIVLPVTFAPSSDDQYWGGIIVSPTGNVELEYASLSRGGHPDGHGFGFASALASHGDDNRFFPLKNLSVKHVAIRDSATLGFSLVASGSFSDDSTDLTVIGSGSLGGQSGSAQTTYAGYVEAPAVQTVPEGDYTGNTMDGIEVYAAFTLEVDETFHNRGVPYQIISDFYMAPGTANSATSLTIEAGVTLLFGSDELLAGALHLGDIAGADDLRSVQLVADGTAQDPILLTSGKTNPAAGDWVGIYWESAPAGNAMNYVTVEYGGGESGTSGYGCGPGENDSLLFLAWEPTEAFIQNSAFLSSLEGGIVSGWASDNTAVDLVTGNTFSDIGNGCNVSLNESEDGSCPDNGGDPSCY